MSTASPPDPTDVGFLREEVRPLHDLYCQVGWESGGTWQDTYWLGVKVLKLPLDMWIYQEILFSAESRPDLIIETGTHAGGTAYYLASIFDLIGSGRVITVDIQPLEVPEHPRITYLTGSSIAPEIVAAMREAVQPGERVMVILDSDHMKDHVLAELQAYSPLVTPGNYLVVEDTNWNSWRGGHWEPGPLEALREFLSTNDGFIVDRSKEKFLMTFYPSGYLRRTEAPTG